MHIFIIFLGLLSFLTISLINRSSGNKKRAAEAQAFQHKVSEVQANLAQSGVIKDFLQSIQSNRSRVYNIIIHHNLLCASTYGQKGDIFLYEINTNATRGFDKYETEALLNLSMASLTREADSSSFKILRDCNADYASIYYAVQIVQPSLIPSMPKMKDPY